MKRLIRQIDDNKSLYIDDNNGIAWIVDGSTGNGHSAHANIHSSGSVAGMKRCGYWRKTDRTVRSHGWIYNIDTLVVSDDLDRIAAENCRCIACMERRKNA